ncbi:hypothetical protein B0H19DRAFT_1185184 [Mycena capillaripes]|nr:hypothetical protein B0H19DRAFT_1185184 [Mycena capillaripes]
MSSDDELLQLVADSRLTGYLASACFTLGRAMPRLLTGSCAVAALCVLLYDYFSCIPEEVELMWKSRWGIAKIIYLWNRYFSVLSRLTIIAVIVRDISSSQSVWILYGRPQWMMFFFACLGMCEIIVDVFAFRQMRGWSLSIIKGCYAYNVPRFLNLYAAAPLIVTFIMFAMTLYKCIRTLYSADHRVMPVWSSSSVMGSCAAGGSELLIWTMRRRPSSKCSSCTCPFSLCNLISHPISGVLQPRPCCLIAHPPQHKMLRVSEQPELQINENGRGPSKPLYSFLVRPNCMVLLHGLCNMYRYYRIFQSIVQRITY